jgi:hypothetical protein
MDDNRLPLEQRIGSVRDGDTTDHGTPIGSTPLNVQPPRRPDMNHLPTYSFAIGDSGVDCTLADRALIRACYRCYSYEGRAVARWVATELAYQIQRIRLANLDEAYWRKQWRKTEEARHG